MNELKIRQKFFVGSSYFWTSTDTRSVPAVVLTSSMSGTKGTKPGRPGRHPHAPDTLHIGSINTWAVTYDITSHPKEGIIR